jgi:hypothetical protein
MSNQSQPLPPELVTEAVRAALPNRPDVELSSADAAELAANYRNNLAHYQEHVQKSLAEGDYRQAVEKSWGAYAQAIKTIGAEHGLHVSSHTAILRVSGRLTALVSRQDAATAATLTNGLLAASAMHTHFYENQLPGSAVVAGSATVATAIGMLGSLFPPPVAGVDTSDADHP